MTKNQLREVLERQTRTLTEEAINSDGKVSAEQIEALNRLARLVELGEAKRPTPPKRWPVLVITIISLLLVSVLLFARIGETDIELDLVVSDVRFILPTAQQILVKEGVSLKELGASGVRSIEMPRTRDKDGQSISASNQETFQVRLAVNAQNPSGTINLPSLALPSGTLLTVGRLEPIPQQYRLSLKGNDPLLRVEVDGTVRVDSHKGMIEGGQLNIVTPQPFLFQCGTGECDIDMTLNEPTKGVFSPRLRISELSLDRLGPTDDNSQAPARSESTILSGKILFQELNRQEHTLRPSDLVRFAKLEGELRTLRLVNNHVEMKFIGSVGGLEIGTEGSAESLMPTWLEWLKARHELSLFWGTSLYLLGLILGVLRWWGKSL